MAVYADEPSLTEGKGFFLESDGQWSVKDIPTKVVDEAQFSGYLTIQGYNSMIFEMPDGQMWGQKSSNTPVDDDAKLASIARRVAGVIYSSSGFELWEAGLELPKGVSIDEAVETIRSELPVKSGNYTIEWDDPEFPVIMIEMDKSFKDVMEVGSFGNDLEEYAEYSKNGVTIKFEMP